MLGELTALKVLLAAVSVVVVSLIALIVTGTIELETGEDTVEVYTNSQTLHNLADVKDTIHTLADEVCGERSWVTRSWP